MQIEALTVFACMRELNHPVRLSTIAEGCMIVRPPSCYTMPLESCRSYVKELEKAGLVDRPKPSLYQATFNNRPELPPILAVKTTDGLALVARHGFLYGTKDSLAIGHAGLGLYKCGGAVLTTDGSMLMTSKPLFALAQLHREKGEAAYQRGLAKLRWSISYYGWTATISENPRPKCPNCARELTFGAVSCCGRSMYFQNNDRPRVDGSISAPVNLAKPIAQPAGARMDGGAPDLWRCFWEIEQFLISLDNNY